MHVDHGVNINSLRVNPDGVKGGAIRRKDGTRSDISGFLQPYRIANIEKHPAHEVETLLRSSCDDYLGIIAIHPLRGVQMLSYGATERFISGI